MNLKDSAILLSLLLFLYNTYTYNIFTLNKNLNYYLFLYKIKTIKFLMHILYRIVFIELIINYKLKHTFTRLFHFVNSFKASIPIKITFPYNTTQYFYLKCFKA